MKRCRGGQGVSALTGGKKNRAGIGTVAAASAAHVRPRDTEAAIVSISSAGWRSLR